MRVNTAWFVLILQSLIESHGAEHVHRDPRPNWLPTAGPACQSQQVQQDLEASLALRGGGWIIPAGWNPFGYRITKLGEQFLSFETSLDSDIGRFLASVRQRKRYKAIKAQWLEVLRVSKTGQVMRIYRKLDDILKFCLAAGLID